MTGEIPKTYDPASIEAEANRVWLEERCFAADPASPGEPYCIVIPPPNVTGALHLGHAINNTLQDILIRAHRMRGFNTVWIPGIDHAGIATQAVVEKQLKEKENKTRHDLGREALVQRIWDWKKQFGDRILEQLKRMGCSCDWDRSRFTLDEQCARAVRETFFKLFKDGLIYRGKRLVNWDVHLQTSISDDEIYHETVKMSLWHVRYPIEGTDKSMVVATTRPETMLGDTAVAVHSEDSRWNWAIGKSVDLPLTGRKIPIIADDILVDPKFGSGVVKVTPAHDPNDYAVWQRQQGKIEILNILNPDGTINQNGGKYSGMKREAARKKVVEDLTALGLLAKEEPYESPVGHSDRSKTPVEPYLSDQWFVKMAPLAEPALEVVEKQIIKFFPERHAQQFLSWLGEKRDWPISRQLWWGHRIPVWTMLIQTEPLRAADNLQEHRAAQRLRANESIELLRDFLEMAGVDWRSDVFISRDVNLDDAVSDLIIPFSVRTKLATDALNAFNQMAESYELKEIKSGAERSYVLNEVPGFPQATKAYFPLAHKIYAIRQDPDVLDTWFSSALWPHSTLGWPEDTPELRKWYPGSVLVTSREIITLWVARMVMMGMYNMGKEKPPQSGGLTGENRPQLSSISPPLCGGSLGIPFHHVYIHTTILDGHGERMSKSKGNGVDPVDVIETHGADALRFTLTHMATETQDVRLPVKKNAQGKNTSDKFDIGRNFCNKIWNVGNFFVIANLANVAPEPVDQSKWTLADRWIVSRFNRTVKEADAALAGYRFDQYAKICYDFFWNDFCDWYVEASKPALKAPATAGQTANVLAAVLDGALRLLHPMVPFITETIWWRLNEVRPQRGLPGKIECPPSKRLILAAWPAEGKLDDGAESLFPAIQEIISAIRKLRNDYKVDVKKSVDVSILAPGDSSRNLKSNRGIVELLATCRLKDLSPNFPPVPGAVRVTAAGCDIFIEGLQDQHTELQRTAKRTDELTRQIQTLQARLANEAYISKAPPHLVQQTKDQLAEAQRELGKLGGN
ncbi:MAG: valine--tRNA ligase [Tepidisphaeraceae bacterium]|jgi:valyl-tRNA synthetase